MKNRAERVIIKLNNIVLDGFIIHDLYIPVYSTHSNASGFNVIIYVYDSFAYVFVYNNIRFYTDHRVNRHDIVRTKVARKLRVHIESVPDSRFIIPALEFSMF